MKSILLSIKPEWLAKILNGEKTIEICKKFPKDYVGWVYLYCSKDEKHKLEYCDINNGCWSANDGGDYYNGKVVARFNATAEEIICRPICGEWECYTKTQGYSEIAKASCLKNKEIVHYLKGKNGTAIHINDLEIFDRPRELCEFHTNIKKEPPEELLCPECGKPMEYYEYKYLTKAPQNYCYVEME